MTGGSLGTATIEQGTTANISGGTLSTIYSLGTFDLTGGTIQELRMTSIEGNVDGGVANISGGTIGLLRDQSDSIVNITGGSFVQLSSEDTSVLNLYGTGFQETPNGSSDSFRLTGTLEDGQKLNTFYDDSGGSLVFHDVAPVPEASTTVSFGLLLALGLGSIVVAGKKKKAMKGTSMSRFTRTLQAAALLALAAGLAPHCAQAQTREELDLGSLTDPTQSGTATLFADPANSESSTATASGTYTYYGDDQSPVPLTPTSPILSLYAYGASTADVTGGGLAELNAYGTSHIQYTGGSVADDQDFTALGTFGASTADVTGGYFSNLEILDNSTFTFSGGTVEQLAEVGDSSVLDVTGGEIDAERGGLEVSSTANISGGLVQILDSERGGVVNISGGTIDEATAIDQSVINITGGTFGDGGLGAGDQGVINLFGTHFLETPTGNSMFQLTGTLEDGQRLDTTYYDGGGGSLVLHNAPVPEASTTVSFGLLLIFGLGSVVLARRKRAA